VPIGRFRGRYVSEPTGELFEDLLASLGDDEMALRKLLLEGKVRLLAHSRDLPTLRVEEDGLVAVPCYPVPQMG
jgi:hypothetical protein